MVRHALAAFGQIDILVNNAGMTRRADIMELTGRRDCPVMFRTLKDAKKHNHRSDVLWIVGPFQWDGRNPAMAQRAAAGR